MDNTGIEKKLAENGFSKKDLNFLRKNLTENTPTYPVLLSQLRKIFIGGIFLRVLFIFFFFAGYAYDATGLEALFVVIIFGFLIAEFFAPIIFGAKVFIFLGRNKI